MDHAQKVAGAIDKFVAGENAIDTTKQQLARLQQEQQRNRIELARVIKAVYGTEKKVHRKGTSYWLGDDEGLRYGDADIVVLE